MIYTSHKKNHPDKNNNDYFYDYIWVYEDRNCILQLDKKIYWFKNSKEEKIVCDTLVIYWNGNYDYILDGIYYRFDKDDNLLEKLEGGKGNLPEKYSAKSYEICLQFYT